MKAIQLVLVAMVVLAQVSFARGEDSIVRPNAIQFVGTIEGNYPIQMTLARSEGTCLYAPLEGACEKIHGTYCYNSKVLPIDLDGVICMENQCISLEGIGVAYEEEYFDGNWDRKTNRISGTWRLNRDALPKPFELRPVEADFSRVQRQRFYQLLREQFYRGEGSLDPTVADAQWDAYGGYLKDFDPGRRGGIDVFTTNSLRLLSDLGSTAYSFSQVYSVQLLPHPSHTFILYCLESCHCETENPMFEDTEEDLDRDASHGCEFNYDVKLYQWTVAGFETLTDSLFPKGFQSAVTRKGEGISVAILPDRFSIAIDGIAQKWKWENGRFVGF